MNVGEPGDEATHVALDYVHTHTYIHIKGNFSVTSPCKHVYLGGGGSFESVIIIYEHSKGKVFCCIPCKHAYSGGVLNQF